MLDDLSPLIAFEKINFRYNQDTQPDEIGLRHRVGSRPILLTAPHACQHFRNQRWKQEDEYTGTIAEWLHRLTGAHALYITHRIAPDPHDDHDHSGLFKQTLRDITTQHQIQFVLDLHGASARRQFGVCLGTMRGVSCPAHEAQILETFAQYGYTRHATEQLLDRFAVNLSRYTGGLKHPTITQFASQELGIPAAQLEINAWLRVLQRHAHSCNARSDIAPHFQGDHSRFRQLMLTLIDLIPRLI